MKCVLMIARDRDPAARELLDDHRVGRQVEAQAAVLLGDRDAEEAELLHLLDDRLGELVLVVVVLGVGEDLLVGELADHLGDRLLLVGLLAERAATAMARAYRRRRLRPVERPPVPAWASVTPSSPTAIGASCCDAAPTGLRRRDGAAAGSAVGLGELAATLRPQRRIAGPGATWRRCRSRLALHDLTGAGAWPRMRNFGPMPPTSSTCGPSRPTALRASSSSRATARGREWTFGEVADGRAATRRAACATPGVAAAATSS